MQASALPEWAQWLQALGLPMAGLFGLGFAWLNYRLRAKERRDERFDRRLALVMRLRADLASMASDESIDRSKAAIMDVIERRAIEVEFLFGSRVAEQVRAFAADMPFDIRLEGSILEEGPPRPVAVPRPEFFAPFRPFMRLEA